MADKPTPKDLPEPVRGAAKKIKKHQSGTKSRADCAMKQKEFNPKTGKCVG